MIGVCKASNTLATPNTVWEKVREGLTKIESEPRVHFHLAMDPAVFAIGDHTPVAPRDMLAIADFGDNTSAQMTCTFRF